MKIMTQWIPSWDDCLWVKTGKTSIWNGVWLHWLSVSIKRTGTSMKWETVISKQVLSSNMIPVLE